MNHWQLCAYDVILSYLSQFSRPGLHFFYRSQTRCNPNLFARVCFGRWRDFLWICLIVSWKKKQKIYLNLDFSIWQIITCLELLGSLWQDSQKKKKLAWNILLSFATEMHVFVLASKTPLWTIYAWCQTVRYKLM